MPVPPPHVRRAALMMTAMALARTLPAAEAVAEKYARDIQPLLEKYCYDCHANGVNKGSVSLEHLDAAALRDPKLWSRVLKNTRSNLMPPADEAQPAPAEVAQLHDWIKRDALGLDLQNPDPGRVTVRRLNRTEYRNTIRALTGVDFDTQREFPADDTGHGFEIGRAHV